MENEKLDILKHYAAQLVASCEDADLLDFICQLLVHEAAQSSEN